MARKLALSVIGVIFIMVVFVLIRLIACQNWFDNVVLDNTLAPLDVIGLILTTIVTIWIAWYITKKVTADRYEVEFLIIDLKDIHKELELLQAQISDTHELGLQSLLQQYSRINGLSLKNGLVVIISGKDFG